jgi:hypothetical protein
VGTFLPVELKSFTARIFENKVELNWSTATELNNHGFEIERSLDNTSWSTIGFREGNGTVTEQQNYFFSDDISEISSPKLYYRLKQIDFDGSFEYSEVVKVEITPSKFSLEQNYPNPFNPSTSIQSAISSAQFVTLKVYDLLGREIAIPVNEEKPAGSYKVEFNASNLPSVFYFYRLIAGDLSTSSGQSFIETQKMIIIK